MSNCAIDRTGTLVDVLFSGHRDMKAARAFFRSAKAVTGLTPDRVTTDGHDSYLGRSAPSWAEASATGPVTISITEWNKTTGGLKADTGRCGASNALDQPPGSVAAMTNCATSSALVPALTSTCPPIIADCSSSAAPRPCWPSWKPRNGMSVLVPQVWLHLLARDLTEPCGELQRPVAVRAAERKSLTEAAG